MRIALLEADVALPVVQALIERIKVRAVGQEVLKSLTPGQALIKVVRDELTAVMGAAATDLNLNVPAPAIVLMAGLQGAGKTTTVGKIARILVADLAEAGMVAIHQPGNGDAGGTPDVTLLERVLSGLRKL